MAGLVVRWLQAVLAALLAGSVLVQTLIVTLLFVDSDDGGELSDHQEVSAVVILVLGIVTVQVVLVSVWRLVTMVRRGTVFSNAAFRHVDVVIGALVAGAGLAFALGVVLAPGEAVAPGVVLLIGGIAVAVLGAALVVYVLRLLLAQAVARDAEAAQLKDELDQVI